jgi:nucleotide-binding universal stress UspA family protein
MYRKILLAYDGTREGRAVLREGADLAERCGADVHLLAVVRPDTGILFAEGAEPGGLLDSERQRFEQVLEEGRQKLLARGLAVQTSLRSGDPAREILALAESLGCDLIALGHHRRNAFSRWWRGSVDEAILADAPCSLLIAVSGTAEQGSPVP